jgi:hypothetical protein
MTDTFKLMLAQLNPTVGASPQTWRGRREAWERAARRGPTWSP